MRQLEGDAASYFEGNPNQDRIDRNQGRRIRELGRQVSEVQRAQSGPMNVAGLVLSGVAAFKALTTKTNKSVADLLDSATPGSDTAILAEAVTEQQSIAKLNALGDLSKAAAYFGAGYSAARSMGLIDDEDSAEDAYAYYNGGGGDSTTLWLIVGIGFLLLYRRADGTGLITL